MMRSGRWRAAWGWSRWVSRDGLSGKYPWDDWQYRQLAWRVGQAAVGRRFSGAPREEHLEPHEMTQKCLSLSRRLCRAVSSIWRYSTDNHRHNWLSGRTGDAAVRSLRTSRGSERGGAC